MKVLNAYFEREFTNVLISSTFCFSQYMAYMVVCMNFVSFAYEDARRLLWSWVQQFTHIFHSLSFAVHELTTHISANVWTQANGASMVRYTMHLRGGSAHCGWECSWNCSWCISLYASKTDRLHSKNTSCRASNLCSNLLRCQWELRLWTCAFERSLV